MRIDKDIKDNIKHVNNRITDEMTNNDNRIEETVRDVNRKMYELTQWKDLMQEKIVTRKEMENKLKEMRNKQDDSIETIIETFSEKVLKTLELKGLIGIEEKYTSVNDWIASTQSQVSEVCEEIYNQEIGLKARMPIVERTVQEAKALGEMNTKEMEDLKKDVIGQMRTIQQAS